MYTIKVTNPNGGALHEQYYTLQVQAPLSVPLLNVSCHQDGGADILCRTDTGDDPWFSIMVNGHLLLENSTSSRTVEGTTEVTVPVTLPRPWDVTCSVRNHVSNNQTRKTQVTCPVPLSDPDLEVSCLHNGHLQISCSVKNGSDPIFSLSVNKNLLKENEKGRVNVSSPTQGPWDIQCAVKNILGEKSQSKTKEACPVPPSEPVLKVSCHNGSLQISCSVDSGTSPYFNLSVNEEIFTKNVTEGQKMINVTSPTSPGPWHVHCSVRNSLGEKTSSKTYETCPGSSCMTCLQKSVIGGVVAVIVTTSPFLIASFYIRRNTRKDQ
ncbi:uncharacterized protein LOC142194009 [Leptodactylus fuscus]|uniref:uncharacterized protein LOC142194009 n=1 Tax=Leptodactylus fuscus TaxID=238119 RepID=UPI003F4E4E3C